MKGACQSRSQNEDNIKCFGCDGPVPEGTPEEKRETKPNPKWKLYPDKKSSEEKPARCKIKCSNAECENLTYNSTGTGLCKACAIQKGKREAKERKEMQGKSNSSEVIFNSSEVVFTPRKNKRKSHEKKVPCSVEGCTNMVSHKSKTGKCVLHYKRVVPVNDGKTRLSLDMTKHPELNEWISKVAELELRTPANQAIILLKYLKKLQEKEVENGGQKS
jgi:hypothetical protein